MHSTTPPHTFVFCSARESEGQLQFPKTIKRKAIDSLLFNTALRGVYPLFLFLFLFASYSALVILSLLRFVLIVDFQNIFQIFTANLLHLCVCLLQGLSECGIYFM